MRDDDTVWTLAEEAGVTCFGMSAALLHACSKAASSPARGATWVRCAPSARPGALHRRTREDRSPRRVPNEVVQVSEVPRTLSGEVLEVPVRKS